MRKQRLNYIAILPSLITLLNGICGFAAIVLAANNRFALAGYVLLLAMIADMLDGRVARMSQSTSSFGGQLDSLCDIISFGVAPAFLMLKVLEYKLELVELNFLERFVWLAAAAYISCTAIRLARFNVENEEDESEAVCGSVHAGYRNGRDDPKGSYGCVIGSKDHGAGVAGD